MKVVSSVSRTPDEAPGSAVIGSAPFPVHCSEQYHISAMWLSTCVLVANCSRAGKRGDVDGIGSFQVHPGHLFEGMLITGERRRTVAAVCGCGEVLCWAEAVFASCPECGGTGVGRREGGSCLRCGGSGDVVDHAALEWRPANDERRERHGSG